MGLLFLQEVIRIKNEHPDDSHCIVNDRVEGRLKVIRAFGAGFLKQVSLKILYCSNTSFSQYTYTLMINVTEKMIDKVDSLVNSEVDI